MTPSPLLEVHDLSIAFTQGGKETLAVDRVSFSLERGKTLALVGESGSGKSITALSVVRLLPPSARHPSGGVRFDGQDVLKLDDEGLRRIRGARITMVFQEPMTSLNPLHSIERQVGEILELHGMRGREAVRARIVELLEEVGIPNPGGRLGAYPHQLSGGQRQRVMIAMALANKPDLLIADEPTTALDVTVQAQILALLERLQKTYGMAMLFITHDLGLVRRIADNVCVMQRGKIVEAGPVETVFAAPSHPYTQALLAAEPKGKPNLAKDDAPVIVSANDLRVWFPIKRGFLRRTVDHIKAVDGVSLEVREGATVGVVGESGSGKTTLGLALLRLIRSARADRLHGRADRRQERRRHAPAAARYADRVPRPLWVAVAAHVDRGNRRRGLDHSPAGPPARRAARNRGARPVRDRPRPGDDGPLSA